MGNMGIKNIVVLGGFLLIVALGAILILVPAPEPTSDTDGQVSVAQGYTIENCVADECLAVEGLQYPVRGLSAEATQAILRSLDDTYQMIALYTMILNDLGEGMPFLNIIRTEQHYQAAQKALFDKYGFVIPENTKIAETQTPEALGVREACAIALEHEEQSVRLYQEIVPAVAGHPDIQKVFGAINRASQELHIPALARCAG